MCYNTYLQYNGVDHIKDAPGCTVYNHMVNYTAHATPALSKDKKLGSSVTNYCCLPFDSVNSDWGESGVTECLKNNTGCNQTMCNNSCAWGTGSSYCTGK